MAEKTCVYISTLGLGDSPPSNGAEAVLETLVVPALRSFPEFELARYQYQPDAPIGEAFLEHVMSADLVIADLTQLNSNGFYELGIRHASHLPTVLIAQDRERIPFDQRQFRCVWYPYQSTDDEVEQRAREDLIETIRDIIQTAPTAPGQFPAPASLGFCCRLIC